MWGLPWRQGSIHWSTFDVSRQLAEQGEACLLCRLPRSWVRWLIGRGEACLLVRLKPAPSPTRAVARRTRRNFYYSLCLLLVPTLVREIIILFGIYMSFSRFQYELLVHTPKTDVYRRILECRFTHFAPYVVHIETDIIVRTLPRPSTLAHVVDV